MLRNGAGAFRPVPDFRSSRKTGTNVRGHAAGRWQCQRSGGRHGNPAGRRNLGKVSLPGTEVLAYYSVSQFRLEICNRTDSYARFYPKERRFVFSEKGLKDEALLLHEMIHMHEYALSQLPSQYRERVAACLCESLQKNIYDVDQMVKENLSLFPGQLCRQGRTRYFVLPEEP